MRPTRTLAGTTLVLATTLGLACSSPPSAPHVGGDLRYEPPAASVGAAPVAAGSAAVPADSVKAPPLAAAPSATAQKTPFPPAPIPPPVERNAKPGDGVWVSLPVAGMDPSPLATTVIHPHKIKPFVIVAFVAIDLSRLSLGLVAGVEEPKSDAVPAERRTGLIPSAEVERLVVAMNGGFKRRHGEHGMKVGTDELVPPKDDSCTLARTSSGIVLGTWSKLAPRAADFLFYRQGPPCLVEDGARNADVTGEWSVKKWGASETGDREIRRSAFGLSKDGDTLYFAIGDWIHPEVLADAMTAASLDVAAQFDINYSFTRFVLYERDASGQPVATSPLLSKLKFSTTEYWKAPSARDFFYLTKR